MVGLYSIRTPNYNLKGTMNKTNVAKNAMENPTLDSCEGQTQVVSLKDVFSGNVQSGIRVPRVLGIFDLEDSIEMSATGEKGQVEEVATSDDALDSGEESDDSDGEESDEWLPEEDEEEESDSGSDFSESAGENDEWDVIDEDDSDMDHDVTSTHPSPSIRDADISDVDELLDELYEDFQMVGETVASVLHKAGRGCRNRSAPQRFMDETFLKGANNGYTAGRQIDQGHSISEFYQ